MTNAKDAAADPTEELWDANDAATCAVFAEYPHKAVRQDSATQVRLPPRPR